MKESETPSKPQPSPMSNPELHHPDGALSDPLHEWWEKNGRSLIVGALIVVIGTGVVFGFRAYRNSQEEAIQVAFNDAVATDNLATYAQENAGYPLGGIAALQTANQAFGAEEWDRALEYYTTAAGALKGNPLEGKARIGVAMTQTENGNSAEARKILAAVASDEKLFPAARAEATYFLALITLEAGDQSGFMNWSAELEKIDQVGLWTGKLDYYKNRVAIPVSEAAPEPEATESAELPAPKPAFPVNVPAPAEAGSVVSVEAIPETLPAPTVETVEEEITEEPAATVEEVTETATEVVTEVALEAPTSPEVDAEAPAAVEEISVEVDAEPSTEGTTAP